MTDFLLDWLVLGPLEDALSGAYDYVLEVVLEVIFLIPTPDLDVIWFRGMYNRMFTFSFRTSVTLTMIMLAYGVVQEIFHKKVNWKAILTLSLKVFLVGTFLPYILWLGQSVGDYFTGYFLSLSPESDANALKAALAGFSIPAQLISIFMIFLNMMIGLILAFEVITVTYLIYIFAALAAGTYFLTGFGEGGERWWKKLQGWMSVSMFTEAVVAGILVLGAIFINGIAIETPTVAAGSLPLIGATITFLTLVAAAIVGPTLPYLVGVGFHPIPVMWDSGEVDVNVKSDSSDNGISTTAKVVAGGLVGAAMENEFDLINDPEDRAAVKKQRLAAIGAAGGPLTKVTMTFASMFIRPSEDENHPEGGEAE